MNLRSPRDFAALVRLPARIGWRDHAIGAALGLVYFVWLLATARSLGFPRDEGMYFRAATDYVGWWRSVLRPRAGGAEAGRDRRAWSDNHEHPVLMKTLFGVSWWLLHEKWHVLTDASTAFRLPAMSGGRRALDHVPLRRARLEPPRRARRGGAARR